MVSRVLDGVQDRPGFGDHAGYVTEHLLNLSGEVAGGQWLKDPGHLRLCHAQVLYQRLLLEPLPCELRVATPLNWTATHYLDNPIPLRACDVPQEDADRVGEMWMPPVDLGIGQAINGFDHVVMQQIDGLDEGTRLRIHGSPRGEKVASLKNTLSMSLKASGDRVPRRRVTLEAGTTFETTFVSGRHVNLMVAVRPPEYHSRPHAHDAEQLNYVQEGEVWFFVGKRGYHLRQGDFFRVPRGAVHWMWNRIDRPLILIEAHSPSMTDDPLFSSFAVRLFDSKEDTRLPESPLNRMVEDFDPKPVEGRYPDPDGAGEP